MISLSYESYISLISFALGIPADMRPDGFETECEGEEFRLDFPRSPPQRSLNARNTLPDTGKSREYVSPHVSTPIAGNEPLPTPSHLKADSDQDLWVFDYIDVQHVQPIVEAMDEDGSGFISVKEANKFALTRPKGMNLLHWIAYWAAGWHINLTYYYHKIYTTMIEMHESLEFFHPANRSYVEIYLNYYYFLAIEGVLRSIKVLPDDARHEPNLVEIAENIRNLQEQRLSANLNEISFLLDSPENIRLVAGPARAQTWFLPLVYLLLQRHLAIIKLAERRVISEKELPAHSESFWHIFNVFEERSRNLEVAFMQVYREADAQIGNHAYGMHEIRQTCQHFDPGSRGRKLIKKAVVPISKVKLKDPRSLNARNTLSDTGKSREYVSPHVSTPIAGNEPLPTPSHLKADSDQGLWVFDYIDVQHVQPIVEAMDEDGSGFISVKEAKKFALTRREGMSLLRWIASNWATGWHINLTDYYHKIYTIMVEMHTSLESARLVNRSYVESYLNYYNFQAIEGVLRSIKVLPDDARHEPKLVEIVENIRNLQEQRLSANLNEISFLLESPENARLLYTLQWFLPLVYLLLQRHLAIIKLSERRVISKKELPAHSESFMHIFNVFEERSRNLEVIFIQVYCEADAQFGNHAYGMFYNTYKGMPGFQLDNKLLYYRDTHGIGYKPDPEALNLETDPAEGVEKKEDEDEDTDKGKGKGKDKDKRKPVDISILNQKPDDNFTCEEVAIDLPPPPADHTPHPIEGAWMGAWMGVCYRSTNPVTAFRGCFELAIGPVIESKIVGRARYYLGKLDLNGEIRQPNTNTDTEGGDGEQATEFNVAFKLTAERFTDIWFKGKYDISKEAISGEWVMPAEGDSDDIWELPSGEELGDRSSGTFLITRTPVDVYRYRRIIDCPSVQPSWSLAKRRWSFALNAVLLRTQRQMNSSKVIKTQLEERARWIELAARDYLDSYVRATRGHLSDEGRQELLTLTWILPPAISAIYEALSIYLYNRMIYHCFSRKRTFVHHLSHSLIRSTVRLHYCEMATLITQARSLSERIKNSFMAANKKSGSGTNTETKLTKYSYSRARKDPDMENIVTSLPSLTLLFCACCLKDLTLPCWACVKCELDTLFCLECELINAPVLLREGFSGIHTRKHPLLRINDSSEVKTNVEPKTTRLERRLAEMEERLGAGIDEGLSALEEKVNIRLDAIQSELKVTTAQEVARLMDNPKDRPDALSPIPDHPSEFPPHSPSVAFHDGVKIGPLSVSPYESRLEERLAQLEAKVDNQFGRMLSLVQELVGSE
ncbi:hypothetical protein CPC08DRAFT_729061 [Agrocybe pediades]|nr:hypothetical protein CPC08DRAFT_729061 [Agrocybe pediades]